MSLYIFGRRTEGTTTEGLKSEEDILVCIQKFKVIQDISEWTKGNINLLILRDSTAPGYCRLQLLKQDRAEPDDTLPTQDYVYDEFNRVIVKHTLLDEYVDPNHTKRNGTANTRHVPNVVDTDITFALECFSKLQVVESCAGRQGRGGWPTEGLFQQIEDEPFFFVPVGNKLSSNDSIEWRISASLAERRLMFSLNIVQLKCYVILKILMKTYMSPKVGTSISSYHCKTALLYCIEKSDANFWREDNLLASITRCLKLLENWVTADICPHFIMTEANLLAGKVTSDNKGTIQSVLQWLIQNNVYSLMYVGIDLLGPSLFMKLGTKPNSSTILDSISTRYCLGTSEVERHWSDCIHLFNLMLLWNQADAISNVRNAIHIIESRNNISDILIQEANESTIMFLNNLLGSLYASSSIAFYGRIQKNAVDLLDIAASSDISSMLKHASVLYCSGKAEQVERLFKDIDGQFERNIVFPACHCYPHQANYSIEEVQTMYTRKREVRYANCVIFTSHEEHCIPQALRYELCRVFDVSINRIQFADLWMVWATVVLSISCISCSISRTDSLANLNFEKHHCTTLSNA